MLERMVQVLGPAVGFVLPLRSDVPILVDPTEGSEGFAAATGLRDLGLPYCDPRLTCPAASSGELVPFDIMPA